MKLKLSAVASTLLVFIVLVALPLAAIRYVPTEILSSIQQAGFDIQLFATETAILGLVVASITLIKGIVEPTSVTYLILSLVSSGFGLIFALIVLGVGNIADLGLTRFQVSNERMSAFIRIDLRIFIWITFAAVLLQMVQNVYEWREVRADQAASEAEPSGR
jgi:hypothetical protein